MTKPQVHVISHTHWDREWYMPYEKHHFRLVRLLDSVLDLLDREEHFRSFHLDGQTIIVDDYLQVRPEQRERITRFIREGRLIIGPWYVLQDEFLTSAEANVRNLQIGHREASALGRVAKVGYFPDSFGNMGQAPQLLAQAGIRVAVFGRGVRPKGKHARADASSYESPYSEMVWESPDGTRVLGVLFANWYNNGMEIPVDAGQARAYWDKRLANAEKYASTSQLLLMNGCDHQPVQEDLTAALQTARELYPNYEFVHSNFVDYCEMLVHATPDDLAVIAGELRSQGTDGWGTLVNTASARVYLKQANERIQSYLEKVVEPLAAISHLSGYAYPHAELAYAWKTLMQNHPHDSICGCSVDEVHREMMTRFAKAEAMAQAIAEDSLKELAVKIDTSAFGTRAGSFPFIVFNTAGRERSGVLSVDLEVDKRPLLVPTPEEAATNVSLYQPLPQNMAAELEKLDITGFGVFDLDGNRIDAEIADLGVQFGYMLPDHGFRQPYMSRRIRVKLSVGPVPALGCKSYALAPIEEQDLQVGTEPKSLVTGPCRMANGHLAVDIAPNGTIELTHLSTGRVYRNLLTFEDTGDIGNEYMFMQPPGAQPLYTDGLKAEIKLVEDLPCTASYEIVHEWEIPANADSLLDKERQYLVAFPLRKSGRAHNTVSLKLRILVTLDADARELKFRVRFDNQATDHRLRVLFPTAIAGTQHHADSIFEIASRNTQPSAGWKNPSYTQHQHAFVAIDDDASGLAVANRGLNEYEVLRDGQGTIALTLLRAVGELGDWGHFPTPEAQCLGEHTAEFALIPYAGESSRHNAATIAYGFQTPWTVMQKEVGKGRYPGEYAWLDWEGDALALSSFKISAETGDLVARWFNTSRTPTALRILSADGAEAAYKTTILEEAVPLEVRHALPCVMQVRPAEIITAAFVRR